MRILVGCEYSGKVRGALRANGHDAISCDFLSADDGDPNHYQGDILEIIDDGWDAMIAFPTCTYLCNSGVKHLYVGMKKENGLNLDRLEKMRDHARTRQGHYRRQPDADYPALAVRSQGNEGHLSVAPGS